MINLSILDYTHGYTAVQKLTRMEILVQLGHVEIFYVTLQRHVTKSRYDQSKYPGLYTWIYGGPEVDTYGNLSSARTRGDILRNITAPRNKIAI